MWEILKQQLIDITEFQKKIDDEYIAEIKTEIYKSQVKKNMWPFKEPVSLTEPVLSIIKSMEDNPDDWDTLIQTKWYNLEHFPTGSKLTVMLVANNKFAIYATWMTEEEKAAVATAISNMFVKREEGFQLKQRELFMNTFCQERVRADVAKKVKQTLTEIQNNRNSK